MKKLLALIVCAVGFVLLEANPVWPAILEVRPPGSVGTLGDVYTSIQQAIDEADPGDTINVAAGVYDGNTVGPQGHLTIDKANLTLKSAEGKDSTTINVANGVGIDIRAGADNFILGGEAGHGFTIAGKADTTFAIQLENAPSGVEISHNAIDTTGNASMGISVGAAGAANLTISNNDFIAESGDGCVWGPGLVNLTVSNNTFDGGSYAIQTSGVTSSSPSVISGNVITGFAGSGGIVISNGEETSDLTITGNTITGCSNGIYFAEYCAQGTPGDMTTVTVEDNTLSTNDKGIRIGDGAHVIADQFVITRNKISGNSSYGVQNEHTTRVVTAAYNWWGDVTGPYHPVDNPDGQGDTVSDNVIFEPWYANETMLERVTVKIGDTEDVRAYCDTIQDGIDAAYEADTIIVAAGTYTEYLHITKDGLTIEGAGIDSSIIDLEGLTPYWHYSGCSSSFASRAGVLISGYGSPDEIIEDITFRGFTVKNAGLNPPITATGTHTDPNDAATLTDSSASWTPGELVGQWIHNYGDRDTDYDPARSYGQITANTETTVTATLSGGVDNDWDTGDEYLITPYQEFHNSWWIHYPNYDWVRGISIANANDVLIQNCKITNNGYGGITTGYARCVSTHKYSENITIDNCIVTDHQRAGIGIGNHAGAFAITNNTCERNKSPHYADPTREYCGYGIQVSGRSSSLMASGLIANNTCNDNGFEGIIVDKYTDGVTVKKNTVTGHNLDQDGAGIFMYHWGRPEYCKNHDVNDNTVTGNIRGIVAYYTSDSVIQNNTITTNSGDFDPGQGAIKLDGCTNVEVKNNTISCDGVGISTVYWEGYGEISSYDNTFTGNTITGAKFAGIFLSGDVHDNTFTANTITGTTVLTRWEDTEYEETQGDGVFIDDDAGTGNVFNCNKICENEGDGMENQTATAVDATSNWWGDSTGPGGVGGGLGDEVSANVDFFPWLLNDNIEECAELTEVVADFVVDDNWAPLPPFTQVFVGSTAYYIDLNAFDTIQEAVDAASDGNSISVAEGNYVGAIVSKQVTIVGANPGGSVITTGVPYKDGSSLETAFRLDSDANAAEIRNFTIDCNRDENFFFAIFSRSADDVVVDSLTVNKPVQGITNYAGSNWQITNNELNETEAAGGGGIAIYLGTQPPDYTVLKDNLVKDNVITAAATAPDFTCPAISMGLDLRSGRYGSLTGDEDLSGNQILNNDIIANYTENEVGIEVGVLGLGGDPNKIAATLGIIHDNLIRANIVDGANYGIYFYTVADLAVQGNEIIDCNEGIHMKDGHTGIAINYNAIYGSASYGLNNNTGEVVDAEYNWWGDVSGPSDPTGTNETDGASCYDVATIRNADGLGDAVNEKVAYCPWLAAPVSPSDAPYIPGDLNYDGCINWKDIAILALNWLEGCE